MAYLASLSYRSVVAIHLVLSLFRVVTGLFFLPWGFFALMGAHPAGAITGFHRVGFAPLFFFGLLTLLPTGRLRRPGSENAYLVASAVLTLPFLAYVLLKEFSHWGLATFIFVIAMLLTAPATVFTARCVRFAEERRNAS